MRAPHSYLSFLLLALLLAAPLTAQKLRDKKKPLNDAVQCYYCKGDAKLMEAAGIVSHGGFEFGKTDTMRADQLMVSDDIRWMETEHFRIGFALGTAKVEDRDKIRAECARLTEVLEDVPSKPRNMDPWLRLHLYGQRLEDQYKVMQTFLGVTDADFPAEPGATWNGKGIFWGTGPMLGMPRKFEVLILPSEGSLTRYLRESYGLTTKKTQRWHIVESGTLQVTIHEQQASLKKDAALHGHVIFTTTQMMLNAFKHYSYDLPIWLMEGMGHLMERRLSPEYNTFSSSEGGSAQKTRKQDWEPPCYKLASKGDMPSFSSMVRMRDFADLDLPKHYGTWSVVDFMEREHPGFLRKLLHAIKGMTDGGNITNGSKLSDVQRNLFKSQLKLTYAQLDRAWVAWVGETYRAK
ncbi:MAG: hypothetical protein ACI82F_003342 [Planctomycetota bacterium]|jgi:hypothetical protein